MWSKFLLLVTIVVGISEGYNVLPDVGSSLPNETRGNWTAVNRNDSSSSWDPREFQTDRDDRNDLDSPHDQNQDSYRLDEEPHGRSLEGPRASKQNHSVCSKFLPLSIFGIFLIAIGIFNGLVNGAILWDAINSSSVTSLSNSVTNSNNNDNMDTNNDLNVNLNFDYNVNDFPLRHARQNGGGGKFEPDQWDLEDFNVTRNDESLGRKESCVCAKSRGGDSWLSAATTSFQGVWTVAQDLLSENPECASRMACEVASSFVPSSISPFLVVLPSRLEGARSLLLSAAAGHCAVTYNRCPVSLGPIVTSALQWLEDSS